MQQPFIPETIYKRVDIQNQYGGNKQSGICPLSEYPFILIFSGSTGVQYGYKDSWENQNVFSYTVEGQAGDMRFVRGNLALREHLNNRKRVFLFKNTTSGYVKYICELEYQDSDYFETHDTE